MSFRYQASSVSGFATADNSSKAFRPSRWAISANVAFSASDNNNLPLIWALRIRFSAAKYSFLRRGGPAGGRGKTGKERQSHNLLLLLNVMGSSLEEVPGLRFR